MRLMTLPVVLFLLTTGPAVAQDWKKDLARPLVTVTGGTMRHQATELCTFATDDEGSEPRRLQVRMRSEAPAAGLISRDNFVAVTTFVGFSILDQLGDADCKTTSAVIGAPDLDINLVMTADGLQVEIKDTRSGETNRETTLWSDLFAG